MSSNASLHPSRPFSPHPPPGPQLVPPPRPHYTALSLWHLLSLDAPTVASLWTVFIARCSHVHLPWTEPVAMFLAVWMIYAADRLLDARVLDAPTLSVQPPDIEARHRFHHRYRTAFIPFLLVSSVALAALLHRLDPASLHLYVLLATLLAAWMLLIHIRPQNNGATRRLPKELAVGIFFPAAVFIPTIARTSPTSAAMHFLGTAATWIRPNLLPAAILFATLCTLNCLCLYAWEHPTLRSDAPSSHPRAHWTTRWATHHLTQIALSILVATTFASFSRGLPIALPALACSLSTAALFALNLYRRHLSALHLRAMADLVLLTPLLFLPFLR